ncbi:MAG: ankyrin repeat domain-containing protein [Polyangiaceae bacterium]
MRERFEQARRWPMDVRWFDRGTKTFRLRSKDQIPMQMYDTVDAFDCRSTRTVRYLWDGRIDSIARREEQGGFVYVVRVGAIREHAESSSGVRNGRLPLMEPTGDPILDLVHHAEVGSLEEVEHLLRMGIHPRAWRADPRPLLGPPPGGYPALHAAARAGRLEIAGRLIAAGAAIDARDQVGNTALSEAAEAGHGALVALLLDAGAERSPKGAYCTAIPSVLTPGYTPLMLAARAGELNVVRLLLDAGADPNAGSDDGITALMNAAESSAEVVHCLLEAGAKIDAQDVRGSTALMWAAMKDNAECARALIDNGANIELLDAEEKTAAHLAAEVDHAGVLGVLLGAGAQLSLAEVSLRAFFEGGISLP